MIRGTLIVLVASVGLSGTALANPAEKARGAAQALADAAVRLSEVGNAEDRIKALTETVQAYEAGLAALRESLRDTALAVDEIRQSLQADESTLSALLGALTAMERSREGISLFHPGGPLETLRAGMILGDVAPALEARLHAMREPLVALRELSALRSSAEATLEDGLASIRDARAMLAKAVSDRIRPTEDPSDAATLQALVNSADTLEGFAAMVSDLSDLQDQTSDFSERIGSIPLPVRGEIFTGSGQVGESGGPGLWVTTPTRAVVTAPVSASVRFAGPLPDMGLVAILEPEAGYLMVLAGLGELFTVRGDVLDQNAPIGLMGGKSPQSDQNLKFSAEDDGQAGMETLYIEIHKDGKTLDPVDWFEPAED